MITYTGKIPKRISPDNLIDSYVEFRITSDYNASKIENVILEAFKENGLKFKKIPFVSQTKGLTDRCLHTDGIVRFFIREDKIGINCVNGYIGWKKYLDYIMIIIQSAIDFVSFESIELKYVSKWDGLAIFDVIDGDFNLTYFPRFDGFTVSFPARRKADSLPVDPVAEVVIKENIIIDNIKCSIVDITVEIICKEIEGHSKIESIFKYLDEIHFAQKDMFFSLLSEEFVETLNPQW